MGSLWQAFAWGFLGLRPRGATLSVDPRLPPGWHSLAINVRFRGSRVRLRVEGEELEVTADSPVELRIGASDQVLRAGAEGLRVRVPATR
jgi:trehalose/maltose hydrolase-like predicted phosphorylase